MAHTMLFVYTGTYCRKFKVEQRIACLDWCRGGLRVNDYNPLLLMLWQTNIDIQFVAESSLALAHYVSGYVTKAERSNMQEMWQEVSENKSVYSRLWSFGGYQATLSLSLHGTQTRMRTSTSVQNESEVGATSALLFFSKLKCFCCSQRDSLDGAFLERLVIIILRDNSACMESQLPS